MNLGTIGRTLCAALMGIALQAQLPPEVELDRQLLAAREARGEKDWLSVRWALAAVRELSEEHDLELPPEFRFLRAELSLFGAANHDEAIKDVTEYLGLVGRGGARYEDALSLLNRAERAKADAEARAKRQKAAEERARAEAEAARKRAEAAEERARAEAEAAAAEAAREKDCDEVASTSRVGRYLSPHDRCWLALEKPAACLAWQPKGFWVKLGTSKWNKQCSEGRAEGTGTLTWRALSLNLLMTAKGTMRAGKPVGFWTFRRAVHKEGMFRTGGGITQGSFRDGLRQGLWTFDGGRSEEWAKSNYLDNKKHGEQSHGQGSRVDNWALWEHGKFVKHLP